MLKMVENGKKVNKEDVGKIVKEDISKSLKMIKLLELGLSVKEVSEIMNVRYNFVYNVMSNKMLKDGSYDSKVKVKDSSKKMEIEKMLLDGNNKMEICKILKVEYNRVWKIEKDMKEKLEDEKEIK